MLNVLRLSADRVQCYRSCSSCSSTQPTSNESDVQRSVTDGHCAVRNTGANAVEKSWRRCECPEQPGSDATSVCMHVLAVSRGESYSAALSLLVLFG
jgi:hypothetical protein